MRKILSIVVIGVLLFQIIPIINADVVSPTHSSEQDDVSSLGRIFTTCYIEATGKIGGDDTGFFQFGMWKTFWFRPFLNDFAVVSYWHIPFDEASDVTIYSRENGRILWDHEGEQRVNIIWFYGSYIPYVIGDSLHITITGKALIAQARQAL